MKLIGTDPTESLLTLPKRLGLHQVLSVLFGLAVLTIGLDQYRPFLGRIGNFSDILSGFVLVLGGGLAFMRMDARRFNKLLLALRTMEPVLWGGVLFAIGGAIASLGSEAPGPSWRVTLKHFGMLCIWLPWATLAIQRYLSVSKAYALYVTGICLIGLATFSDLFLRTRFGGRFVSTPIYMVNFESLAQGMRYGGPTGHPNSLGYLSAMALLLCLATVATNPWRRAPAPLFGMLVCAAALLVSGSRGALLGVVAGSMVIILFANAGERRRVVLVIATCLATLIVASKAANWGPQMNPLNRLMESVQPRRSFEADWQRAHDLQLSQRLLSHDPLTGYGMENIDAIEPPTKGAFHLPHFILLQSWVAGGFLALLGAMWLYAATLWLGWKAAREKRPMAIGLLAACAAFILMDMVAPGMDQRFKWFPAALLFATVLEPRPSSQPARISPSTT
jgi:O-antigen ligase